MNERVFRVLLADDVAALRKLVRLALEGSGRFKVVAEASTGVEAIERARQDQPDLILLDLSMPELDGLEALPLVLQAAPRSHVVVLSGFNHVRMAPIAKRLGASAYLEKGLDPIALTQALLQILEPGPSRPPGEEAPPPARFMDVPPIVSLPDDPNGQVLPPSTFRILVLEPDARRAAVIAGFLGRPGTGIAAERVATWEEARRRLEGPPLDLVLVDPFGAGPGPQDLLIELLTLAASTPVVALLPDGHDLLPEARRLGVEDALAFEALDADLLARSLRYAIERRRAHEARRVVRDQQGELHRMRDLEVAKTQFFNAAAHELGTPLTPIRLQIALLKQMTKAEAGSAQLRSLDILDRNVRRLAQLNEDILDVARLQSGRLSVDKAPLDLAVVVQEVVESFEPMARAQAITLTSSCPRGLVVEGDARRLTQVMFNLVNNAIKFTPRGGRVSIQGRADSGDCEVSVRDTGPGLRPDQIERLFQPFSQVLENEQPPGLGTGLGLFVSRGIVDLHGGRIWCDSPGPGRGTTFSFTLPRSVSVAQQVGNVAPAGEARPA